MGRRQRTARGRFTGGELPFHARADERMSLDRQDQEPRSKRVTRMRPLTDKQSDYMASIRGSILTFGLGDAGTGKSYCSVGLACEMLADGSIEKILITRPAVEAGEDMGFLPGEISDKFAPYFAPVLDILNERLGASFVTYAIRAEKIVALPLAYMRGHTFKDAFVIMDEAQNTTPSQMKMFLTRMGENVKCVVNGDATQSDLAPGTVSGLEDAVYRFRGHRDVGIIRFERADVVRSGFCMDVLDAYSNHDRSAEVDVVPLPKFITG
jgi:phosphate starvation-inducible PhoH-like protein